MFLRAVKISGFGGLLSAALFSKKTQDPGSADNHHEKNLQLLHQKAFISNESEEKSTQNIGPENFASNCSKGIQSEELNILYEEDKTVSDDHIDHEDYVKENTNILLAELQVSDVELLKPNEQSRQQAQAEKLKAAITKARDLVWCKMYESGAPGMIVAVSVNGKQVWQHGFGYADLENRLLAQTSTVMRIASISKPITMAVLAKLWEEGKVDLDSPIQNYVPDWPEKTVDGEKVEITVRQLCCHMSGVRHYARKNENDVKEIDLQEYYIKDEFSSTDDSIKLFRDDDLLSKPGEKFNYTTHGFTLLAKVIENVTGQPFDKYMEEQFAILGLHNTYLDKASPIIYNRSKYYVRDEHHRLLNAPYVDNSYKWAGGGFLSNVSDLVKFGNAMIYSYQQKKVVTKPTVSKDPAKQLESKTDENPTQGEKPQEGPDSDKSLLGDDNTEAFKRDKEEQTVKDVVYNPGPFSFVNKSSPAPIRYLPGFLKSTTVEELWAPQDGANMKWGGQDMVYGLGWAVRQREKNFGFCLDQPHYVAHTGGAMGASSVLLVAPQSVKEDSRLPRGVVVAILCNMKSVGLYKLAADLSKTFQGIDQESPVKVQKVYQC